MTDAMRSISALPVDPLVSIIIPCYNSQQFLQETLLSCASQTYRNFEIIAVDDGSTDSTLDLLCEFKSFHTDLEVSILTHPHRANRGVAASRLLAFQHAKGELISLLDSDDRFDPAKLQKQVDCFLTHEEIVLCHTAISVECDHEDHFPHERHFDASPITPYKFSSMRDYLMRLHVCNSSVMIRASALDRVKYPSIHLNHSEDWLLWLQLSGKGLFIQLPQKLTTYRLRADSLSRRASQSSLNRQRDRVEFLLLAALIAFPSLLSLRLMFLLGRSFLKLTLIYNRSVEVVSLRVVSGLSL